MCSECIIIISKTEGEKEFIPKEKVNTGGKSVFEGAQLAGHTGTSVSAVQQWKHKKKTQSISQVNNN